MKKTIIIGLTLLVSTTLTTALYTEWSEPWAFTIQQNNPYGFELYQGWNLIGWHENESIMANQLGYDIGASVITKFNPQNQEFISHIVGPVYDNFEITQGMGLFVYIP